MSRDRARVGAAQLVVLPIEAQVAFPAPYLSNDLDRLGQSFECDAGCAPGTAVGLDRIPEGSCAQSKLETASAQYIQAGGGFGQDGGWTEGQACHIGEESDPGGGSRDHAQQRPGVDKAPLVRVVLHGHIIQAEVLRLLCHRN